MASFASKPHLPARPKDRTEHLGPEPWDQSYSEYLVLSQLLFSRWNHGVVKVMEAISTRTQIRFQINAYLIPSPYVQLCEFKMANSPTLRNPHSKPCFPLQQRQLAHFNLHGSFLFNFIRLRYKCLEICYVYYNALSINLQ